MRGRERLKRAVEYFFASNVDSRQEVVEFAEELEEFGETVVVGGMLRDICLAGTAGFQSDVDFACHPADLHRFDAVMLAKGATRNRFGGYGIVLDKWKVDVWPIQRTWAAVEGYVKVECVEDLLKTTFFSWDAILYSRSSRSLYCSDDYFQNIENRVLDINLSYNPNPVGNSIRALRYSYHRDALISGALARFIVDAVKDEDWSDLSRREVASFSNSVLRYFSREGVLRRLEEGASEDVPLRTLAPAQLELPFSF